MFDFSNLESSHPSGLNPKENLGIDIYAILKEVSESQPICIKCEIIMSVWAALMNQRLYVYLQKLSVKL